MAGVSNIKMRPVVGKTALTAIVLACGMAVWMVPLLVFCLPAVGSMAYSFFMEKILLRYTPREEAEGTWYGEA